MANPGEPRREHANEAAKAAAGSSDWLPDDSFLLDVDDLDPATPATPAAADAGGEEFVLVDDDLVGAAAIEPVDPVDPVAPAAPAAPAAPPTAALKLPRWMTEDASVDDEALPAFATAGDDPPPAADRAPPAADFAPVAAELAPVAAELEPLAVADDEERHSAAAYVAADAAPAVAEPAALSAERSDGGEAAAPALAPVVPLRRGRRRWLAAAGMLLGATVTGALLFELERRGLGHSLFGDGDAESVAVAPRRPPAPTATMAVAPPNPAAAAIAAPAATEPPVQDLAPEAAVAAAEPAVETTAEPLIQAPIEAPIEAPVDPLFDPVVDAPVEAADPVAPVVATAAPSPTAVDATVPAAGPAPTERATELKANRSLPEAAARTGRSPLEGSDTIVQLRNGHLFRGRVSRVRDTRLTLRVGSGECVFDLADIALLDATQPEYRRENDMPEASVVLTNGQRLRGRLMKQTPESVVLMVANGQLVCPRADVREVSFTGRIHF
ncbi:MAG: hypothetical protein FJ293_10915 [Planctomycetes bacterium]|nr:hypothetical protein [Planctomycetota bacterium]